jgi:hypothetical protein
MPDASAHCKRCPLASPFPPLAVRGAGAKAQLKIAPPSAGLPPTSGEGSRAADRWGRRNRRSRASGCSARSRGRRVRTARPRRCRRLAPYMGGLTLKHDGDLPSVRSGPVVEVDRISGLGHASLGLGMRAQDGFGSCLPIGALDTCARSDGLTSPPAGRQRRFMPSREENQAGLSHAICPSQDGRHGTPL